MSPGYIILWTCQLVVTAVSWYAAKQLKRDMSFRVIIKESNTS